MGCSYRIVSLSSMFKDCYQKAQEEFNIIIQQIFKSILRQLYRLYVNLMDQTTIFNISHYHGAIHKITDQIYYNAKVLIGLSSVF